MISEFTSEPIPIALDADAEALIRQDISRRLRTFLGHYDLRIYITDKAYVDVGRGSFNAASRVEYLNIGFSGCIGTVGQFCDFALPCKLFAGGEHHNELPVNITMTGVPTFQAKTQKFNIGNLRANEPIPFEIGHAVLISADVKVMSGAKIGDGAVLAANALATGVIEPFWMYGGLPARKLKPRFDEQTMRAISAVRWWDFDTVYLGNNLDCLQELAVDTSSDHVYRKPTPRLVIKLIKMNTPHQKVEIAGFVEGERMRPLSEAPVKMQKYLAQLGGPGPYYWLANAWE
ncbi:MAG TPA: hypothetical protein VEC06_14195 [Paucimonas sp.]|nr:hypothetical protein [Paucimonas sp.]